MSAWPRSPPTLHDLRGGAWLRDLTALIQQRWPARHDCQATPRHTEFTTSTAILAWAEDQARRLPAITSAPGKPTQNRVSSSRYPTAGCATRKLLNEKACFFSLDHAREKLAAWAADYNTRRPHSSIGYQTPRSLCPAPTLTATGRSAAPRGSSTARPVAPTAPQGVTIAETPVPAG